jgi:hypothetical protein
MNVTISLDVFYSIWGKELGKEMCWLTKDISNNNNNFNYSVSLTNNNCNNTNINRC